MTNSRYIEGLTLIEFDVSSELPSPRIDLTDYSLLPNGLVFVQNTYSSFLRNTTEYKFVIGSKNNKKQFRIGEYWNITFICA